MEEKSNKTLWIIVGVVILVILGYLMYLDLRSTDEETTTIVTNFEECARAGFPVSEGTPRECTAENGLVYTEVTTNVSETSEEGMLNSNLESDLDLEEPLGK
jgi:hypothetical protein